ncbi:hypothetical protein A2765_06655 [Candidatus Kaiserbacteria bacterium RIFCSPHIGHO2_01_FULL_56_24]|uniref:Uncharacterized protein n=1 Tax=Candidatus Kaiserbacteria bacterium RIFCSPHIGHO2_01_FULL_56_24 TaxID=1798487 RepID=A0A1F6DD66_9BACT|nr:MAG: hypothetical protein A2765_06655 [Candidatus Kaiserbacteria bacterium RIFCSPHIGHO2_01_FULL_56_24]
MSRASVLILLGILTILTPFSGLPVSARTFLAIFFGACVVSIGVALRADRVRQDVIESRPPAAVEEKSPDLPPPSPPPPPPSEPKAF